ncbi:hypothetical protein GCM10023196_081780 [Actinoallomurus vinaceus]|uniref:DUF2157 domain-containing protein n=1 Tax=Actinoallomurus vinaceus TaxID=1080074 RepID=A0ABP8UQG9_9ACTN
MSPLEHRLRRWLRLYPIDQREEMLGVLLASAGPGQDRPSPRDAADLVGGAVRVRLRREIRSLGGTVWRDAFAVLGLVTILALFVCLIASLRAIIDFAFVVQSPPAPIWPMWAPWPLVAALSLLSLRRTAIGIAWAAALAQVPWLAIGEMDAFSDRLGQNAYWFVLAITAAAALSVSDGLRRALSLLGWWRVVVLLAGFGAFAYTLSVPTGEIDPWSRDMSPSAWSFHDPRYWLGIAPLALIAVACTRLRTDSGRRWTTMLILSLAPTVYVLGFQIAIDTALAPVVDAIRILGSLAVVAVLTAAAASRLREWRRSTS